MSGIDKKLGGFKEEAQGYGSPSVSPLDDDAAEFAAGFAAAIEAAVAEHRRAGRPVYGIDETGKFVQS